MASWSEIAAPEPDFAELVRGLFDARVHKTLATLRRDGSPRISGVEASFGSGELWFGSMWEARKALDLRRDPRFALHSGSVDPPDWEGDARISGSARELTDPAEVAAVFEALGADPPARAHLFRADVGEASLVRLGEPADHLVIEWWKEGVGLRRIERR